MVPVQDKKSSNRPGKKKKTKKENEKLCDLFLCYVLINSEIVGVIVVYRGMSRRGEMMTEIERDDMEEMMNEQRVDLNGIPSWKEQITIRGIFASLLIGIIYSIIVTKLNLTTGLVPNLNVSAALLAFVFIKTWTKLLQKANIMTNPFTRQENTIIQTCAVACYSIAVGGNRT